MMAGAIKSGEMPGLTVQTYWQCPEVLLNGKSTRKSGAEATIAACEVKCHNSVVEAGSTKGETKNESADSRTCINGEEAGA